MPKEFRYRGQTMEQLQAMSIEQFMVLIPSRQRRSLNRGISEEKRSLLEEIRKAKESGKEVMIKTHVRDMVIIPSMLGMKIHVYNGKEFVAVDVKLVMVGHYLGEYAITNKKVVHGTPGIGASRSSLYVPLK